MLLQHTTNAHVVDLPSSHSNPTLIYLRLSLYSFWFATGHRRLILRFNIYLESVTLTI